MEPFLQMSALGLVFGIVESSSQHLIVGFHARSVTRAQALYGEVRQMKSRNDDNWRLVSIVQH